MSGNALLDLLILALPAAIAGLWWTGSKARELAVGHAKRACSQRQLQFLDQTVSLTRMKPVRGTTGSSCMLREYGFEFTDHGQFRDTASITMRGHILQKVHFPYTRDEDGNRIYVH
jgi:hypothetical protein